MADLSDIAAAVEASNQSGAIRKDNRLSRVREMEERLKERADGIADWLKSNVPEYRINQLHLDDGTPERAYWHYGYMVAIKDLLAYLSKTESLPNPPSES